MKSSSRRSWLVLAAMILAFTAAGRLASAEKVNARYTAQGLREAFAVLCRELGYRARVVEVDQSEFPFLVYGVLEGKCDYNDIRDTLNTMRGYAYTGSFTAARGDGSVTCFSLNMIPRSEYEHDDRRASSERLMDRLRQLALSMR